MYGKIKMMVSGLMLAGLLIGCVINSTRLMAASSAESALAMKPTPEYLYQDLPADVVPELAQAGQYQVAVKTLEIVNPAQFDPVTKTSKDRALKIELWYPTPNSKASARATSYVSA